MKKKSISKKRPQKVASHVKVKPNVRKYLSGAAANLDWTNRSLCSTLNNFRELLKVLNEDQTGDYITVHKGTLATMRSLVEEIQVYADRMEAGLSDVKAMERLRKDYKELKSKLDKLEEGVVIKKKGRYEIED